MRKLIITAVVACLAALAVAAPASANKVDLAANLPCQGTSTWQVNTVQAYADITINSSNCEVTSVVVDDSDRLHVNQTGGVYTGSYRVNLLAAGLFGRNTFVATADRGSVPIGPVVATAGLLNAELTAANLSVPGSSTEIHRGTGSCGLDCYEADVTWVHVYDRIP